MKTRDEIAARLMGALIGRDLLGFSQIDKIDCQKRLEEHAKASVVATDYLMTQLREMPAPILGGKDA